MRNIHPYKYRIIKETYGDNTSKFIIQNKDKYLTNNIHTNIVLVILVPILYPIYLFLLSWIDMKKFRTIKEAKENLIIIKKNDLDKKIIEKKIIK